MKNLRFLILLLLSSFILFSCGGKDEETEEAWEDFDNQIEEYDVIDDIDPSIPQELSLFKGKLSATVPGNFVMVATDSKPAGNGLVQSLLEQWGLSDSDEIVFSFIYTEMEEAGQTTEGFYEMAQEKPRPNTTRVSMEMVTINDRDWVYEQYETEMEEGTVVVDNFVCMIDKEIYTIQSICDKPVIDSWLTVIEDFKNSLTVNY